MSIKDDIKRYLSIKEVVETYSNQMEDLKTRIMAHIASQPLRGVAVKESERISPKWKEEFKKVMGDKFEKAERDIIKRTIPSISKSLVIDESVHEADQAFILDKLS